MPDRIQSNALPFGVAAVVVVVLSLSVLLIARPGASDSPGIASNPTVTQAVAGESVSPGPTSTP